MNIKLKRSTRYGEYKIDTVIILAFFKSVIHGYKNFIFLSKIL